MNAHFQSPLVSHATLGQVKLVSDEWEVDQEQGLFISLPPNEWDNPPPSFDWSSVRGFDASPEPTPEGDLQLLRGAIEDLKLSNLSRLTRIVRDWTTEDEDQPEILVEFQAEDLSPTHEFFHDRLAVAEHRLLEREAQKDLWAWFLHWRDLALEVLDPSVSGNQVLNVLKDALAAIRRRTRMPALRQRDASAERLLYLAESIVPHAPPRPLSIEPLASEAG